MIKWVNKKNKTIKLKELTFDKNNNFYTNRKDGIQQMQLENKC